MTTTDLFSVPIFFLLFRETLEAAVIVSILLAVLRQLFPDDPRILRGLNRQVWLGTFLGLLISVGIGAAFIAVWYTIASNIWATTENLWEGSFSLFAALLITVMAIGMLKTSKMQDKWKRKLTKAVNAHLSEVEKEKDDDITKPQRTGFGRIMNLGRAKGRMNRRRALFLLPLVTVMREGLEAMVFVSGVALSESPTSIPLAAICGILCGIFVGFLIYRGGNTMNLHYFFVASTCLLLLIAAGLFSKAIFSFENNAWSNVLGTDADEQSGAIPYNVKTAVWHVNCCNPEDASNGGWTIFNAILGWNNTATIGSIVGYVGYWLLVCVILVGLKFRDRRAAARQAKSDKNELESMWDDTLPVTDMKKENKLDADVISDKDKIQDEENQIELEHIK